MKKKLLSITLASIMCLSLVLPASASNQRATNKEYNGAPFTCTVNNYSYRSWSALYASGSRFHATTYTQTTDGRDAPAEYMRIQARLCDSTGYVRFASKPRTTSTATSVEFVNTDTWSGDAAYSWGWAAFLDESGHYSGGNLPTTELVYSTRSAAASNLETTLNKLEATLNADGTYPTNQSGETYGIGILCERVGQAPDLIAAVGADGTSGYIRDEDLHADYDVPEEQDVYIPLYDQEGNVIGSFCLNGIDPIQDALMAQLDPETGNYPTTSSGETYGPEGLVDILGYAPDLIAVYATNGEPGYMRREERDAYRNLSSEKLNELNSKSATYTLPVYDLDGSVIGEFAFKDGTP